MPPIIALLAITLPAMAAVELPADTFATILALCCVIAGLGETTAGGRPRNDSHLQATVDGLTLKPNSKHGTKRDS